MRAALPAAERSLERGAARTGLTLLGRVGFVAKGSVYALVGALALRAAARGGAPRDQQGAVRTFGAQPFGDVLLVVIGIGLLAYAIWRLSRAVFGGDFAEGTLKRALQRCGHLASCAAYTGLAIAAFQLAAGNPTRSGEQSARTWAGRLLEQPFGSVLLCAIGAVVVIVGGAQLVETVRANFRRLLDLSAASAAQRTWLVRLGRIGHAARGVVFVAVGVFAMRAAFESDASEVKGLAGTLAKLQAQPYGATLLASVALGLLIYGLFMLVSARFLRVPA